MPDAARAYAVLDLIQAHPQNLRMNSWAAKQGTDYLTPITLDDLTAPGSACTACYGSWVALHAGFEVDTAGRCHSGENYSSVFQVARRLLDIDSQQAIALFHRTPNGSLESSIRTIFGDRPEQPYNPDLARLDFSDLPLFPRELPRELSLTEAISQVASQYIGSLDDHLLWEVMAA